MHKGREQERKKGMREWQNSQKTVNQAASLSPYLSMTALDINGEFFNQKISSGSMSKKQNNKNQLHAA